MKKKSTLTISWLITFILVGFALHQYWALFKPREYTPLISVNRTIKITSEAQIKTKLKDTQRDSEPDDVSASVEKIDFKSPTKEEEEPIPPEETIKIKIINGVHYEVLNPPLPNRQPNEVLEFFWYGSPHCLAIEPVLRRWVSRREGSIFLTQIHTSSVPAWMFETYLFYGMRQLGFEDEAHVDYMEERHAGIIDDESMLNGFMSQYQVTTKQVFDAAMSKEAILERTNNSQIEKLSRINGVPNIIVAGRYRVLLTGLKSFGEVAPVLDALLEKAKNEPIIRQRAKFNPYNRNRGK